MVIYLFKTINSYTCILWDVIIRGVNNSDNLSVFTIHTLKLYRSILYFSSSLFMKKTIELFHNLPNFRCSDIDEDRETYFLLQPLRLPTWFLHYWNDENLLYPFSLHIIFANLFFVTKIWCSELFDVLQYLTLYYFLLARLFFCIFNTVYSYLQYIYAHNYHRSPHCLIVVPTVVTWILS